MNIFIGVRPPEKWLRTRSKAGLNAPTSFEHFDFSGPLLSEGEHFVHVPVSGGGAGVCRQLQSVLRVLERQPERGQCIASEGQRLAREMSIDRVYDYMSGILREASARQQPDVAREVIKAERSRRVDRSNYFSFIPPAKRPWMEHIFVPWHADRFNATPFLPPHGVETASGLFH